MLISGLITENDFVNFYFSCIMRKLMMMMMIMMIAINKMAIIVMTIIRTVRVVESSLFVLVLSLAVASYRITGKLPAV